MARTTAAKGGAKPAAKAVKTTKAVAVKPVAKAAKKAPAAKAMPVKATAATRPATQNAVRAVATKVAAKPAAKQAAKPATRPAPLARAKAATPARLAKDAARGLAGSDKAKVKTAAPARSEADARPVLVRDSFTMPEQEYAVLGTVKQACLQAGFEIKKSELLRIGVALLGQLDATALRSVLDSLPQLKTGRPPAA